MIQLVFVPKEKVQEVWKVVENDISLALIRSNRYADSDHMKDWCISGKLQLWILWDDKGENHGNKYYGVVVTEILNRPLQKCLNIRIMTGRRRQQWQHLISVIEDYAVKNGVTMMELIARPGWEKILNNFNYRKSHVLLEKPLTNNIEEKQ